MRKAEDKVAKPAMVEIGRTNMAKLTKWVDGYYVIKSLVGGEDCLSQRRRYVGCAVSRVVVLDSDESQYLGYVEGV